MPVLGKRERAVHLLIDTYHGRESASTSIHVARRGTGVSYVTGMILVTGLVVSLMLCSHPGFEDSGQMGIKQE